MAPLALNRGVTILMEPLAPHLCNVINTLEEAMTVVRAVNSLSGPHVRVTYVAVTGGAVPLIASDRATAAWSNHVPKFPKYSAELAGEKSRYAGSEPGR